MYNVLRNMYLQDCRQVSGLHTACLYETPWSRFVAAPFWSLWSVLASLFVGVGGEGGGKHISAFAFYSSLFVFFFFDAKLLWFWALMRRKDPSSSSVTLLVIFLVIRYYWIWYSSLNKSWLNLFLFMGSLFFFFSISKKNKIPVRPFYM